MSVVPQIEGIAGILGKQKKTAISSWMRLQTHDSIFHDALEKFVACDKNFHMAMVHFTSNLRRHVDSPSIEVLATSVHQALVMAFARNERLKTYVLDDQGHLRKHMRILVDGVAIKDLEHFTDAVKPNSEVWVMQALSGG